jgi:hypothetical protein
MRHAVAIRRESREIVPFAFRLQDNLFGQQILRESRHGDEKR